MPEPIDHREVKQIANDLVKLVKLHDSQGAPPETVAAGLAAGLTMIARGMPAGAKIMAVMGHILTNPGASDG